MDGAGGTRVCHAVQPTSEDCGAPWQREGQVRVTGPVCVRRGRREHSGLTPFASELPAASLERSTSRSSTSCSTLSTTSTHGGAWCPVAQVRHAHTEDVSHATLARCFLPPRHVNRLCLATDRPLLDSGTAGYLGQVGSAAQYDGVGVRDVCVAVCLCHTPPWLLCRLPSCARGSPSASSAHPRADARCTPSAPSAGGFDAAAVDVADAAYHRSSPRDLTDRSPELSLVAVLKFLVVRKQVV